MNLREKILHLLKDSSSQAPVMLVTLRKATASLVEDPQELYTLLDLLFAERHLVNRASGYREGKPYVAYWLTGVQTPQPAFTISPPRTHIVARSETDKPASPISTAKIPNPPVRRIAPKKTTSDIPSFLRKTAEPKQPNHHIQEINTMLKKSSKPSLIIIETVMNKPGITRQDLTALLLKEVPGYSEKSAKAMIMWCQDRGRKIVQKGTAPNATYHPIDLAKAAASKKPPKKSTQPKPASPAVKVKPRRHAPIAGPAVINAERINILLSESDQILLRDGGNIIALDQADSARLYRFIERIGHI
jgi:hypothetical protein